MKIGQRIKQRRKVLKISADELAKVLNVSRSTIFRYESGYIEKVPLDILEPIAKALKTTPQYLMGWEDEQPESIKNKDDLTMGDVIRSLRIDKHLSLVEFSEEIGIPVGDLKEYENGTKQLHASEINKISDYFKIEAAVLIEMLLTSSGKGVTWEQHKIHIDHMVQWNEEFGYEIFTDEERDQLIHYARFLISQRKK